jgi:ABC-type amino acid transport substrate-binding protein
VVRAADKAVFDDCATLSGKTIVVTRGSTADIDAKTRYPHCTIQYVDVVAAGHPDPQEYIVTTLIANRQADAFGEGDVSNQYLRDKYGTKVVGGLALADCHPIAGPPETFNFITRNASSGVLERLNAFIARNRECYAPKS